MYDQQTRDDALARWDTGVTLSALSRITGINRSTLREWVRTRYDVNPPTGCFRCDDVACPDPEAYAYLLGQYLGDGHLVTGPRTPRLRIACADAYPGIAGLVDAAVVSISRRSLIVAPSIGCSHRGTFWKHWPCLLPQHGPGRKHTRPIVLAGWQREIVARDPWPLIRGLIHSDGCRLMNSVVAAGKRYSYPRYLFTNESQDIMAILQDCLDAVGVEWRMNRPNSLSVARRASVAVMDEHIGPKR